MFALILTVCATAAMDDCKVYSSGNFPTEHQCKAMASIQRDILGPEINYRLECEPVTEEEASP